MDAKKIGGEGMAKKDVLATLEAVEKYGLSLDKIEVGIIIALLKSLQVETVQAKKAVSQACEFCSMRVTEGNNFCKECDVRKFANTVN
jgi:hypothetical protein